MSRENSSIPVAGVLSSLSSPSAPGISIDSLSAEQNSKEQKHGGLGDTLSLLEVRANNHKTEAHPQNRKHNKGHHDNKHNNNGDNGKHHENIQHLYDRGTPQEEKNVLNKYSDTTFLKIKASSAMHTDADIAERRGLTTSIHAHTQGISANDDHSTSAENGQSVDDEKECKSDVSPAFCTMVDWTVPSSQVTTNIHANSDLQVELMYINFEGSRYCKQWYAQLQCRYVWPTCDMGRPCQSSCFDFVDACKGAVQECASFPTTDCYEYVQSAASLGTQPTVLLVVTTIMLATFAISVV